MLFDNYSTQAAQASLDSLWHKTQVITNNLANVDTPGYKSRQVSFEQVLRHEMSAQEPDRNGQANVQDPGQVNQPSSNYASKDLFRTTITQDVDTSVRIDGNNVSLEKEETELWKTYAQYSYLVDRVSGHYNSINSAISNMRT